MTTLLDHGLIHLISWSLSSLTFFFFTVAGVICSTLTWKSKLIGFHLTPKHIHTFMSLKQPCTYEYIWQSEICLSWKKEVVKSNDTFKADILNNYENQHNFVFAIKANLILKNLLILSNIDSNCCSEECIFSTCHIKYFQTPKFTRLISWKVICQPESLFTEFQHISFGKLTVL